MIYIHLPSYPAFGFEIKPSESFQAPLKQNKQDKPDKYTNIINIINKIKENWPKDQTDIINNIENEISQDLLDERLDERYDKAPKSAMKTNNVMKVLGYIPVIGTIIGLQHLTRSVKANKIHWPNKYQHIARASIESLSLGFLLIIPDLILTAYRASQVEKKHKSVLEI